MSFFSFLSSRESKVKNERLEAEISKVCEDLTNGIIELSEKAKKLNELKEKYNKTTSEIQTSATPDETNKGTENKKSFFSNLFGSSNDDDAAPAAPPASTPDVSNTLPEETNPEKNMPAPDVTDELSQESAISAASTAPPEQPPVPDSPFSSLSDASALIKPNDSSNDSSLKSDDSSVGNSSDTFSLSSPTNDDVLQQEPPVPASEPISVPNSLNDQMIPIPTADLQNKPIEGDAAPANNATNEPPKIGGKKKKSKRSKKTISNSTKKPRNSTKTKKVRYDDAKARSQGLAQAFLQAHGQT